MAVEFDYETRQKGLQLRSEIINALASIYCCFLWAELNGYQKRRGTAVSCQL